MRRRAIFTYGSFNQNCIGTFDPKLVGKDNQHGGVNETILWKFLCQEMRGRTTIATSSCYARDHLIKPKGYDGSKTRLLNLDVSWAKEFFLKSMYKENARENQQITKTVKMGYCELALVRV